MKAIGFALMLALAMATPQARSQGYFDSRGHYHDPAIEQREQYRQQEQLMRQQENYRALLEQNRQEREQLVHPQWQQQPCTARRAMERPSDCY